jgi:hypothetical protein
MYVSCELVADGVGKVAAAGYMNADGGNLIADQARRLRDEVVQRGGRID